MRKQLAFRILLLTLLATSYCQMAIAVDLQGKVTARKNGSLMVSCSTDGAIRPEPGDEVAFSLLMQGIEVHAGTGKISEIGEGFVWVNQLTGKANLNHRAVIHTTGQPLPAEPSAQPKQPQSSRTPADDSGWGEDSSQRITPEEQYISDITTAYQACNFPQAFQLAERARREIPDNAWLQQNFATLEILARRSENYQHALNGAYQALEKGQVNESISLLKQAMQNASVQCGQDKQVLSLLEQAKLIVQMERDEAIEKARQRSIANARDSQNYRREIEKKRAEREAIGDLLTGNLLGLLGAASSGNSPSYPKTESHSNQELVQKLVGDSEKNNSEILNKWRSSQGWSTNPGVSANKPTINPSSQPTTQPDLVRDLVDKSEQNNSEALNKWRKSQGWE